MTTLSVELDEAQAAKLRRLIEKGCFETEAQAVRAGLARLHEPQDMERPDQWSSEHRETFKTMMTERLGGEFMSAEAFAERSDAMLEEVGRADAER